VILGGGAFIGGRISPAAGDEDVMIAKILADVRAADRVLGEKEFRAHMATLTTNEADAEAPRP